MPVIDCREDDGDAYAIRARLDQQRPPHAPRLARQTGCSDSPALAARSALERAHQVAGDPATIEAARLCTNRFAVDAAIQIARIEGDAVCQCLRATQRRWIAPCNIGQSSGAVDQGPVAGRSLPFAERRAGGRMQKMTKHVVPRKVEAGRMRGLDHSHRPAGSSHFDVAPSDDDLALIGRNAGRPWEVPHGCLAGPGLDGKWRPALPSPFPLRSRGVDPTRFSCHRQPFNLINRSRIFLPRPAYGGWNSIWIAEKGPW